jgi:hypothetical protein
MATVIRLAVYDKSPSRKYRVPFVSGESEMKSDATTECKLSDSNEIEIFDTLKNPCLSANSTFQ